MINAAAQRTLLVDSGSEVDSNVYESYAEVGTRERRQRAESEKGN